MSDESGARSPTSPVTAASNISRKQTVSSPGTTSSPGPSGHSLKRAVTVDETSQMRRRLPFGQLPMDDSFVEREGIRRRRSSTLSDYSFGDARDLLNPRPTGVASSPADDMSTWASVPLAFALLPAVGGLLFKNGSAVVTDAMLLCLSAVFLHWSVTHPWTWYHSAQALRVRAEVNSSSDVIDDESETEQGLGSPSPTTSTANGHAANREGMDNNAPDVPTTPTCERQEHAQKAAAHATRKDDALAELWVHEILALISCFAFPIVGAYLLHAIRAQLSRPSEGLVSNYNLTIFLLAAELRPLSHLMKLVQCRTLQLQREVHANPYKEEPVTPGQIRVLMARLELLESRPDPTPSKYNGNSDNTKVKQEAAIARDVRNAIQPDLDALNRAVRRYEKKATVLAFQTESRFAAVDTRLNDAIALAAAAAKNSAARPGFLQWLVESVWAVITMPFYAVVALLVLPFKTVRGLLKRKKKPLPERGSRSSRNGKAMGHGRMAADRPPSRVSKR